MKPTKHLTALAVCLTTSLPAMAACNDPAGPGVNWSGCLLNEINLVGANMNGANLSGADIANANFTNASFQGANLSGANIRQTEFYGADFTNANFSGAMFDGIAMGINLRSERFGNGYRILGQNIPPRLATFRGANFTNADLHDSGLGLNFWGADLTGAVFTGVDLNYSRWSNGNRCLNGQPGQCGPTRPLTCFYNQSGAYTSGYWGDFGGRRFEVVQQRGGTPPAAIGDFYWALELHSAYPGCPGTVDTTTSPPTAVCALHSDALCQDTEPFRRTWSQTPNFNAVATPTAPIPQQPQFGASVPSEDFVVASVGAQTDVTDFGLFNDSNQTLYIGWIDGNGTIQNPPAITPPDQSWTVANGAATWESHWYAISTDNGFQCSISLRQGARVNVSDLGACRGIGLHAGAAPQVIPPVPHMDPAPTPITGASTIDFSIIPRYGSVSLASGFLPDPYQVNVTAGGTVHTVTELPGCNAGFIDVGQSFQLNFTATSDWRLTFSVVSDADTTLVIYDPRGTWHCVDDTDGLNPSVTINSVASGEYNIWVGTYGGNGDFPEAVLSISEF